MTLNLFNNSMSHGDCDQCGRLFMFEGPGDRERYRADAHQVPKAISILLSCNIEGVCILPVKPVPADTE